MTMAADRWMRSNVKGHTPIGVRMLDVAGHYFFDEGDFEYTFGRGSWHLAANSFTSPVMPRFYEPDLGANPDSPFARDASGKLIRRSYWLDMTDRSLVMVNGIGAHLDKRREESAVD